MVRNLSQKFAQTQAMEVLTIMNIVNRKESSLHPNTRPGTVKRLEEILPLMSTSIRKLSGVWEARGERIQCPEGYYSKADYAFFLVKSCAKCDFMGGYCKRFLKANRKEAGFLEIQPLGQLKQQARRNELLPLPKV